MGRGSLNALSMLAVAAIPAALNAAPKLSPDARASANESKMTDDERFQLLHGIMPLSVPGASRVPAGVRSTAGWIMGIPRLGIPDIYESDASLGVANPFQSRPGDFATALPSGLALASTFSTELAWRNGAVAGNETRSKGFNVLLAGGVNLTRDPRNGRNFEYLGEDPLLAGTLGGASIKGIQSEGVVSTVKHFALNSYETQRNSMDVRLPMPAARESDLLAFQIAIERGQPGSVMCAYNLVNGKYACGNDDLLKGVLKRDWRYPGWVMSDWGAVHDVSYFDKGLDQQSGANLDKQVWFDKPLRDEVAAGRVNKGQISDAVRRILRSLYAVGADAPLKESKIDYAGHAAASRAVAESGIVLLKNEGGILPLAPSTKSVAVIGGHADIGVMSGGGSSQVTPAGPYIFVPIGGRGMMNAWGKALIVPSSPLKALVAALPGAKVEYDSGYAIEAAAAFAKHADVAIVFATQWQSEGADGSLTLPQGQNDLIEAVAAANPNTIVVLETGNPVKMPWLGSVKAVVEAWYPGQEGGTAIANMLTGAVNPSGRLPITFPKDESQLPNKTIAGFGLPDHTPVVMQLAEGSNVGYRWYARKELKPLFPFGFGLSYTSFTYSGLQVSGGERPVATVTVTNSGGKAGADVPQIYLTAVNGQPIRRLVGFDRVQLAPGEQKTVTMAIDPRLLANWEPKGWTIKSGTYRFSVARSAQDLGDSVSVKLAAKTFLP